MATQFPRPLLFSILWVFLLSCNSDPAKFDYSGDSEQNSDEDSESESEAEDTETGWDTENDTSPLGENLLENPGAETGDMTGWEIIDNGGAGWEASETDSAHTGSYVFSTSSSFCTRSQEINLLDAGFTEGMLDYVQPPVYVEEWIKEVGHGWDNYRITVKLKTASGVVIDQWELDEYTQGDPDSADYSDDAWFLESHTFSDYGTGLRTIYFEDYGNDHEDYSGFFGPKFDDSVVQIGE